MKPISWRERLVDMNTETRFGHAEEYQDFPDFINCVFGFNGKDGSFCL